MNMMQKCPFLEYYPRKRNEVSHHEKICKNLKCILLSENQSGKATHCMIPTMPHCGRGKTMGVSKKFSGLKGLGGEG